MSNKWPGGSSDVGGILRKPNNTIEQVETRGSDLLVFGYACKVFRDDQKALHIDQGKHLIPWMGDKDLKIDRYDVRATLSDLKQYEPPPGGYMNRLDYLSPAEQKAEQLCEEERYYSLYHNEEEEQMYQEEELKRLHQERSTSYGQVQFDYNAVQKSTEDKVDAKSEEPDEIFIRPANLNVPPSVEMPETMRQHAIIEKTAKFISTQGAQMEILIKAKQSNNVQFEFLNQSNRLNPYYKFMLQEFKNGTYSIDENKSNEIEKTINVTEQQNLENNSKIMFAYPSLPVPAIKYKPSASCAYTQLISKIKGVPLPPDQPPTEIEKKDIQVDVPTLLDYNSYYSQYRINSELPESSENSQDNQQQSNNIIGQDVEIKKISTGLMLAQCYASDTEDETDHQETDPPSQILLDFPMPPDYLQHIIDKTAAYVAKNGQQFEDTLRSKQDDRFLFLDPDNEYHTYYMFKVTGVVHPYPTSNGSFVPVGNKPKVTGPVSFSIKSKDDYTPIKPALPQETSDDESETKQSSSSQLTNSSVPEHVQRAIQLVEKQLVVKGAQFATTTNSNAVSNANIAAVQRSRFDVDNTGTVVGRPNISVPGITVKLDTLQQKELKRAEEKVKDRLAQIAREKLGLISKEKQLQLERKKKAMAFLTQIKKSGIPLPGTTPEDASKLKSESDSDSDKSSVHSIPVLNTEEKIETIIIKEEEEEEPGLEIKVSSRSTSRSKYKLKTHKHKKKSKHHSKKKSKKRSHSESRSRSHSRSFTPRRSEVSPSPVRDRKHKKRSLSRKSKKKRHE